MWEVHYSLEAATYLEDNASLISSLFFKMESLADSEGIPTTRSFDEMQGLYYWLVEGHLVVYRRLDTQKIARIIFIKPEA